MGRPLLVDSNDQHRQKKRRFSSSPNTLASLPLNMLYTLATSDDRDFPRESVLYSGERQRDRRNERAVYFPSRRKKTRVYKVRAVVSNDWFLLSMSLPLPFYDRHEFRPFPRLRAPVPKVAESRDARPTESTFENPSNES